MGFEERLRESSRLHDSRIVLALDFVGDPSTRAARAASLLDRIGDIVAGVKLNFHMILPGGIAGLGPVREACSSRRLPLIADIKLNDIEATNLEAGRLLFEGGFDALIANPFVGAEEGLGRLISEAGTSGKGVLLLVYMGHAGAPEGYGLVLDGEPLYVSFARRVKEWHASGAIVSAKSPEIIRGVRSVIGRGPLILSPGIGFQGGDAEEAIRAGTDFAIVGRSIITSEEPLSEVAKINRSMRAAP